MLIEFDGNFVNLQEIKREIYNEAKRKGLRKNVSIVTGLTVGKPCIHLFERNLGTFDEWSVILRNVAEHLNRCFHVLSKNYDISLKIVPEKIREMNRERRKIRRN